MTDRLGPSVARQRRASIAVLGGAVIAILASLAAVSVDLGTAYLAKVSNQHAADSTAYAGALAYNAIGSIQTMNSAVSNLAALNGLPAGAATASLIASPSGDGNNAVRVTVNTPSPQYFAEIFRSGTALPVTVSSYAEVKPNASACIIAEPPKAAGVKLTDGANITAAHCSVASNATVSVPCGTTITTKTLDYNGAVPSQPCSGIQPPTGTTSVNIVKVATVDPLAANTAIAAAFTHLANMATLTGPSGPMVTTGSNILFTCGSPATGVLAGTAGFSGALAQSLKMLRCLGDFAGQRESSWLGSPLGCS